MNEVYQDIEKFIPHLRRYAGAIAYNREAADDLVQDSLLMALKKSHLYRPGTNLRAWLFTIMHNQHVSGIRRSVRAGFPVDPDEAATALATKPNQETGPIMSAVAAALRNLPDEQRIPIESVALDGKSYEEVAEASGLALGTVKSRISRGRRRLREVLDGETSHEKRSARPEAIAKAAQARAINGRGRRAGVRSARPKNGGRIGLLAA